MIYDMLFVVSFVLSSLQGFIMIGWMFGRDIDMPIPLFAHLGVGVNNCYVYFPALCYQTWFWADRSGVLL